MYLWQEKFYFCLDINWSILLFLVFWWHFDRIDSMKNSLLSYLFVLKKKNYSISVLSKNKIICISFFVFLFSAEMGKIYQRNQKDLEQMVAEIALFTFSCDFFAFVFVAPGENEIKIMQNKNCTIEIERKNKIKIVVLIKWEMASRCMNWHADFVLFPFSHLHAHSIRSPIAFRFRWNRFFVFFISSESIFMAFACLFCFFFLSFRYLPLNRKPIFNRNRNKIVSFSINKCACLYHSSVESNESRCLICPFSTWKFTYLGLAVAINLTLKKNNIFLCFRMHLM